MEGRKIITSHIWVVLDTQNSSKHLCGEWEIKLYIISYLFRLW